MNKVGHQTKKYTFSTHYVAIYKTINKTINAYYLNKVHDILTKSCV